MKPSHIFFSGYRYELYCVAKAHKTTHCIVSTMYNCNIYKTAFWNKIKIFIHKIITTLVITTFLLHTCTLHVDLLQFNMQCRKLYTVIMLFIIIMILYNVSIYILFIEDSLWYTKRKMYRLEQNEGE